ncbi:unnamed protein product [Bursaphelenchus okinawaensis]|uniref:Uncharacterized protein n=1 Tax=Bursaphelenchus okinawaensis TaxID=465554 RepID=A0A811KPK0_9BILA|nr:unnamed protein product [Bursaphelenchus okinawaensis]CAG9108058.1 unnamed protein product [Bursaphelenchus okinawaensis]
MLLIPWLLFAIASTHFASTSGQQYGPIPQINPNHPISPLTQNRPGFGSQSGQNGQFGQNGQNGQFGQSGQNSRSQISPNNPFGPTPNKNGQIGSSINLNPQNSKPGQLGQSGTPNRQFALSGVQGGQFSNNGAQGGTNVQSNNPNFHGQPAGLNRPGFDQNRPNSNQNQPLFGQLQQNPKVQLQNQRNVNPQGAAINKQTLLRPGAMYDRMGAGGNTGNFGGNLVSVSNSPGIFINPNRGNRLSPGAVLNLQLTGYINENKAMRDGKTCYCPREECTILENVLHPCYFTFTIVVSQNGGEPAQYISKQFVIINNTGLPMENSGDWMAPVSIQTAFKPSTIDVFVNNLGPVIQGRQVVYLNEFWLVDSFALDLDDYRPTIANQQPQPVVTKLTGSVVRSQLELQYAVSCQSSFLGENCDLQCKPISTGPGKAICTSRLTNISSVCTYDNSRANVENCTQCGLGVMNDACADLADITRREVGVSSAYKVWTIILGVLCGLLLIFFIILLILYICALKRRATEPRERQRIYQQQIRNRPIVSNPLLESEWNKPREPYALRQPPVDDTSIQNEPIPGVYEYSQPPRREAQV